MSKHPLQQAQFALSIANDAQLPPPGPPEIAFAGRSNAGKSTAINVLANRTRLAFASKTPGRTQQINFFRLRSGALLADLPGYGYAAVPLGLKKHWQGFLGRYVATRQSLIGLVLIVDARHGLAELDLELLASYLGSGRPVLLLATKMDKLAIAQQRNAEQAIVRALEVAFPMQTGQIAVVPFSATSRLGLEAAESVLGAWLAAQEGDDIRPKLSRVKDKEKAPRTRGVPRGPKRPSRG